MFLLYIDKDSYIFKTHTNITCELKNQNIHCEYGLISLVYNKKDRQTYAFWKMLRKPCKSKLDSPN